MHTGSIQIKSEIFDCEVAITDEEKRIGLAYRDSIDPQTCMIFPFIPPQEVVMWMQGVRFSLDIIFLLDGRIVHIEHEAPPCSGDPCSGKEECPSYCCQLCDAVIEVSGGTARSLSLKKGDLIDLSSLSL